MYVYMYVYTETTAQATGTSTWPRSIPTALLSAISLCSNPCSSNVPPHTAAPLGVRRLLTLAPPLPFQNEGGALPLARLASVALIGPTANLSQSMASYYGPGEVCACPVMSYHVM